MDLETEEISLQATKLPCDKQKGECQRKATTKATIVWEPQTHCQLFELIRFDAFMVKDQERYWIDTNAEWTTVQEHDRTKKTVMNDNKSNRATRFEIFPTVAHECGSPKPIHKTEYDDIYILYEYGFDMNTGKVILKQKGKFENNKFIKIKPKSITSTHTRYVDEENKNFYYGFVNEQTDMNMKLDLYVSNIYS